MHRLKARDDAGIVVKAGVDHREVAHRKNHRAHQERQQGQLEPGRTILGVKAQTQGLKLGDIDLFDIAEVWDASLRLLHLLCDLAPHADHGNRVLATTLRVLRADRRCLADAA
jgi:hypothetical protein